MLEARGPRKAAGSLTGYKTLDTTDGLWLGESGAFLGSHLFLARHVSRKNPKVEV